MYVWWTKAIWVRKAGFDAKGELVSTSMRVNGVVDWLPHTGGSFTYTHLASSFPVCNS